jgi:uncharacterized protein YecT (DUF1311 family)
VIVAPFLLAAAPVAAAAGETCEDLPQQPMNMCLYEAFERADAAMNAQWKLAAEAMKARDLDIDRAHDQRPGYFETLLASQRAWLKYRDEQCAVESLPLRGGSGAAGLHNACLERMTRERSEQLKSLSSEEY